MSAEYSVNSESILRNLIKQGIINTSDVQNIMNMDKKAKVLKMHPYEISQGKGKDKRWFTYIVDDTKENGRRKVGKKTEILLYNYLYDLYFNTDESYKNATLADIYREWLMYKSSQTRKSNYIRRIDNDYKKYYLNEPFSKPLLSKPLCRLTKIDVEEWAYALIKKYNMSKKTYYNMSIILRQVLDYMVDKEVLESNICNRVKIKTGTFRKVRKKKAETQIFYSDEIQLIIELAYVLAEEKQDENYLAIPLFFRSGMRLGECLGLTFSDFEKDSHTINVHQTLVAVEKMNEDGTWEKRKYEILDGLKGNVDEREILVVDECFEIANKVQRLHCSKKIQGEFLFTVVTPAEIEYKLYSICERLGVLKRSIHKTRKTYISTLLNNGVDADFVREQVGHMDLKTTLDSYVYSTTRKEQQLKKLSQLLA